MLSAQCGRRTVAVTGSTNDDLKRKLDAERLEQPFLLIARRQTAGRGTRGRRWSMREGSLIFSLAVPETLIRCALTLVPIAAGMGVCEALVAHGVDAALKWPNDIWIRGGKAGGILCEAHRDAGGQGAVVIGVGLNRTGDSTLKTTNGWPITGAAQPSCALVSEEEREKVLEDLAQGILDKMALPDEALVRLWGFFDAFAGRKVTLVGDERTARGTAQGIDAGGRLILKDEEGAEHAFSSGSIAHDDTAH